MSDMLPVPVRGTRATVSPPGPILSPVEREAAAFAQTRGAAAQPQAASPAPAPKPEQAAAPRPRQIPRAFLGIDFTLGAVVSDTGDAFPIHPADMPKLLDFAFRVAVAALQSDVEDLKRSLGIVEPGGNANDAGEATSLPEVPADETAEQVQEEQ